jgi:predicted permease
MTMLARIAAFWRNIFHRDRAERALTDELDAYVALLAAKYEKQGSAPAEARRRALIDAGGVEQVKEVTRDEWSGAALTAAARELRYALRSLSRSPAYVITAVATLAIGIGGATAIFTVINGTLLRPLPAVAEPNRLIGADQILASTTLDDFGYPDFQDLHDQTTTLSGLAAYEGTSATMHDSRGSTQEWVSYVSGDFFSVLGIVPAAGRLIGRNDAIPHAAAPVVVLGYDLWQRRFGGSAGVIGTTVTLEGYPVTVIGVAPRGFVGAMSLHPMELWIPLPLIDPVFHTGDPFNSRGSGWFRVVGRLAPGRTVADAQADLGTIMSRLATAYPADHGHSLKVYSSGGMTSQERDEASRIPRLLAIAVALLLLIACANVANLALVRASARRRELATRLALGASRRSLVGRLLIEGSVLAAAAMAAGILLARALVASSAITNTIMAIRGAEFHLDGRVLALALGATALTALMVSIVPALQVMRVPVGAVLKDGAAGATRRSRGQRILVGAQVAASLLLLASAALVAGAMRRALATDPGFDTRRLTFESLEPGRAGVDSAARLPLYNQLLERAAGDPDIAAAAITTTLPPQEWGTRSSVFRAGEEPSPAEFAGHDLDYKIRSYIDAISPSLFSVMGIPIVRGRAFTAHDDGQSPAVVVVSQRLAETLWPGQDALGKMLVLPVAKGPPHAPMRVVGVAHDTRHASLMEDPPPMMYVPIAQRPFSYAYLVLRARNDAPIRATSIRRILGDVPDRLAVHDGIWIADRIADELRPQRVASAWIGTFGAIALLLAALGLYGVVAQGVLQRTRELAVRTALGATPAGIVRLVIGDGMRVILPGVLFGLAGSIAAVSVLRHELAGIGGVDARAMALAALVLAFAMAAASALPARRAARLDPTDALRCD